MPPYAISDAEAAWALATIGEVIEEMAGGRQDLSSRISLRFDCQP